MTCDICEGSKKIHTPMTGTVPCPLCVKSEGKEAKYKKALEWILHNYWAHPDNIHAVVKEALEVKD